MSAGQPSANSQRFLLLCRSATEACELAARPERKGLAACVSLIGAQIGWNTPFGPIRRTVPAEPDELSSVMLDTLRAGELDVCLYCDDPEVSALIAEQVRDEGWQVRTTDGTHPPQRDDPFQIFFEVQGTVPVRIDERGRGWITVFASAPLSGRPPLRIGDEIRMAPRGRRDSTEIVYLADDGRGAGTYGILPCRLRPEEAAVVGEVRTRILRTALGCTSADAGSVPSQILIFEIPQAVDSMLSTARASVQERAS